MTVGIFIKITQYKIIVLSVMAAAAVVVKAVAVMIGRCVRGIIHLYHYITCVDIDNIRRRRVETDQYTLHTAE